MPILDFKELSAPGKRSPPGEDLEALARELGRRMGLEPAWSGRGTDQGRDLVFTERRGGALSSESLRWLVSCKDFAKSGRSVSEHDAGSVTDKLVQHRAGAFLLVTTTTASTGLKALLDGIDVAGTARTLVWDRHELEQLLLQDENLDLVRRHLPLSYDAFVRLGSLPQALRALESFVPGRVYQAVARAIETYRAEETWITGELIWPHDRDSAATIDIAPQLSISRFRRCLRWVMPPRPQGSYWTASSSPMRSRRRSGRWPPSGRNKPAISASN